MMVTFVSQCEKKALLRTRRVLDAFSNRIGSNTWQTVITEDGLIAVKNLLKKTATKNTAVSCHWIRSRSRSELVWIVGNRSQFNEEGKVAVNVTEKKLFMDLPNEKPKANMIYANTHLQLLADHLFAVGYVAEQLCKTLLPQQANQSTAAFIAGCLHDLGKIDPRFQEWVRDPKRKNYVAEDGQHIDDKKFSFDTHPRHNEVSVMLYQLLDHYNLKEINESNKASIRHAVYWHHAKPFRNKDSKNDFGTYRHIYTKFSANLAPTTLKDFLEKKVVNLLEKVAQLDAKYRSVEASFLSKVYEKNIDASTLDALNHKAEPLPDYKTYDLLENAKGYQSRIVWNAINNNIRACLISADRIVSELSASDLQKHISERSLELLVKDRLQFESSLISHIESSYKFPSSERTTKQNEVANSLAKVLGVAVLAGPAGCGKTKIALEWAKLKNAQQIIWICPRVQICQGLFTELTSEKYLPNARIEINTGEFKYTNKWDKETPEKEYFFGDIVITTIDQILSGIISHNKIDVLIDCLNAHVVFDEYHEYVTMPAFNLLFAELVECKKQQNPASNTLLVSATPHYLYLKEVLDIDREDIIAMPSFNKCNYRIEFKTFDETKQDETNPLYQVQNPKTFIISNTALTAQKSFIRNNHKEEKSILLHSKFKKSDKQKWFDEVYESFKKDGSGVYDILRSGPRVQASLNISCDRMISEMSSAENILQRMGRLNRYGENVAEEGVMTIAITESVVSGKCTGSSAKFLYNLNSLQSAKAWYQMVRDKFDDKSFSLTEIYAAYKEFYDSANFRNLVEADLIKSFKDSVNLIRAKILDPVNSCKTQSTTKGRAKISKRSLRGDNRFVQMAVVDVSDPSQPKFLDQYAYQNPINDRDNFDNLTASKDEIEGYGDSEKNLLAHMQKKHHNIFGGSKSYKDFILFNDARDPESPIYLSYIPMDLIQIGGDSARHANAIYYAVCDRQPIGSISIQQLTSNEE